MDKNKLKKETFSSSWFQRTKLPALVLIVKEIKGQAVVPLLSLLALVCLISFSVYYFKSASKLSLFDEHNYLDKTILYEVNSHSTKNINNLKFEYDYSTMLDVLNKIDNDFGNNNNNWGNYITYPVHNMKSMLSPIFAFINCSTEEISSYEESQL